MLTPLRDCSHKLPQYCRNWQTDCANGDLPEKDKLSWQQHWPPQWHAARGQRAWLPGLLSEINRLRIPVCRRSIRLPHLWKQTISLSETIPAVEPRPDGQVWPRCFAAGGRCPMPSLLRQPCGGVPNQAGQVRPPARRSAGEAEWARLQGWNIRTRRWSRKSAIR